jgi:uncharacterized protein DUF5681
VRPGLRQPWQPGQSGNPSGKPKQLITSDKLRSMIEKLAYLTRDGLQDVITDPNTPILELYIASVLAQGIKTGDFSRLAFILDRTLGKPKNVDDTDYELKSLSTEELIVLVKEKYPELTAAVVK